jgi:hypothetical protein
VRITPGWHLDYFGVKDESILFVMSLDYFYKKRKDENIKLQKEKNVLMTKPLDERPRKFSPEMAAGGSKTTQSIESGGLAHKEIILKKLEDVINVRKSLHIYPRYQKLSQHLILKRFSIIQLLKTKILIQ